jgi:hypothetical protein
MGYAPEVVKLSLHPEPEANTLGLRVAGIQKDKLKIERLLNFLPLHIHRELNSFIGIDHAPSDSKLVEIYF